MRKLTTALLAALTTVGLVVPASAAPPDDPGAQGRARAAEAHAELVAYWTPARMAGAQERVLLPAPFGVQPMRPPGGNGGGKPGGGGGGGGGGTSVVTGASWASPERGPDSVYATVGKLFFALPSGNYQCSASLVNEGGAREAVVATAAHCVYGDGAFATNILFIPDFDADGYGPPGDAACDGRVYGCWGGVAIAATIEFVASNGSDYDRDVAFVRLTDGGNASFFGPITDRITASQGLDFSGTTTSNDVDAIGYPAGDPYPGDDLSYCAGPLSADPYGAPTIGIQCTMTGGSSGGPWITNLADNGTDEVGTLVSVTSYGYIRGKYAGKYLYGSVFDASIGALYQQALTATGNVTG